MAAGLAVLLDLIGPARLGRWAVANAAQRSAVRQRLNRLRTARRLESLVEKMCSRAVRNRSFTSPYFSAEQFAKVVSALRSHHRFDGSPRATSGQPIAYEMIYAFLAKQLPPVELEVLTESQDQKRRHPWRGKILADISLLALAIAVLISQKHRPGSFAEAILWLMGFFAIFIIGLVLGHRYHYLGAVSLAVTIRLLLIRTALALVGSEGGARPIRWIALGMFLTGSLLDLVASW